MKIPRIVQLDSGNYFCRLRVGGADIPITAETASECERIVTLMKAEHRVGKSHIKRTPKETTLKDALDKYILARAGKLSPATIRS